MNNRRPIVVGIGELLWDIFPESKQLGGAPVNFAYHVSKLGFDAVAVSALGTDAQGDEIDELLNEKKVKTLLNRVQFPTGTVQVELDAYGVPTYEIKKNVAWDNIPWSNELSEIARQTKAVCFGTLAQRDRISRETINFFLDTMPNTNTYKIFDINLRQNFYNRKIIENSLKKSNILKLNDDELIAMGNIFGYSLYNIEVDCRRIMKDFDLEILILTCGANGSYVFNVDETSFLKTPKVKVADTVGAGDAFTAAFCASILSGNSLKMSHKKAVELSAYVCTQNGAMPNVNINTTK